MKHFTINNLYTHNNSTSLIKEFLRNNQFFYLGVWSWNCIVFCRWHIPSTRIIGFFHTCWSSTELKKTFGNWGYRENLLWLLLLLLLYCNYCYYYYLFYYYYYYCYCHYCYYYYYYYYYHYYISNYFSHNFPQESLDMSELNGRNNLNQPEIVGSSRPYRVQVF